jgi:hypothetical protein
MIEPENQFSCNRAVSVSRCGAKTKCLPFKL